MSFDQDKVRRLLDIVIRDEQIEYQRHNNVMTGIKARRAAYQRLCSHADIATHESQEAGTWRECRICGKDLE